MKPGYFDRVQRIKSHGQMMELLNKRTGKVCPYCKGTGWTETPDTYADGSMATSRRCPRGCDDEAKPVEGGSGGGTESRSAVSPDGAEPSPTPAALTWRDPVKGMEALLSTCGRYSVARAKCDGVYRYTAYLRLPTPVIIGEVQSDAGSAQRLCNDHWLATQ